MAKNLNKKISMPVSKAQATQEQTPEQQKEARFQTFSQQWLNKEIYRPEALPDEFDAWLWKTFSHFSAAGLRMPHAQYEAILKAKEYTYVQFDVIMQLFSMVNGYQLGMTKEEYLAFCADVKTMGEAYLTSQEQATEQMKREFDEMESVVDLTTTTVIGQA